MILPESFWESVRPYFLSRARELVEEAWAGVCEEIDNSLRNELSEALSGAFKSSLTQALEEKFSGCIIHPGPVTDVQDEVVYYLYCITIGGAGDALSGITSGQAAGLQLIFSEGKKFCAVVRVFPYSEFNEEVIEERLADAGWLEEKARQHQEVIEDVMKTVDFPVIPMKFGTVFNSPEKIVQMFLEQGESMEKTLEYLNGRQEWGIKLYCDQEKLVQEIKQFNPAIRDMLEKATGGSQSGTAFIMRKKLEERIQIECESEMEKSSSLCYRRLEEISCAARLNKLLSRDVTGEKADMIVNAAFLVDIDRVEDFLAATREIQGNISSSFTLSASGPWPPYNFAGGAGSDESE